MKQRLEQLLSHIGEAALTLRPRATPRPTRLATARVVTHRGDRNGRRIQENTFAAFDAAVAAGVTAIEFDIRYTQDDEPVVVHDADLKRVFGHGDVVARTPWPVLRRIAPQLPHLGDLVERYAPCAHLMIELKTRGNALAERRLAAHLAGLRPVDDFHVLALDPARFAAVAQLSAACYVPVAKLNLTALYSWALSQPCAGLAGPYALLRNRQIQALKRERGFVGSGFVNKPAILKREIARGVDWIFSDTAVAMQRALDALKN